MKKMMLSLFACVFLFLPTGFAQDEESWNVYMASYENGLPGSTMLRMDLIQYAPIKDYDHLLVAGVTYETSRPDGLPESESFELFYQVEDGLIEFLSGFSDYVHVGAFTHDGERLEYFYLKDDKGVKEKIEGYVTKYFPEEIFSIDIKADKEWSEYLDFLYPSDNILNYMSDQAVVTQLEKAGDSLTEKRRVDHWLFFYSKSDVKQFLSSIEGEGFEVVSQDVTDKSKGEIMLQIWRDDLVDLESINGVTTMLLEKAIESNGDYDGWETFIISEEEE